MADKKVKPTRPKSVPRDVDFLLELQRLRSPSPPAASAGTSVTYPAHSTSTSTSTPIPSPSLLSEKAERFLRLFHVHVPREVLPREHSTPTPWRDVTDLSRILYFGRAIRDVGPAVGFSLNLSDKIEAQARAEVVPCNWLHRRIADHLKRTLGRDVDFVIVLEETPDRHRRLHVHGAVAVNHEELASARAALRRAGGQWARTRQHQAHTYASFDDGWITYAAKNFVWFGRHARKLFHVPGFPGNIPGFPGAWFSATNRVRRRASEMWEADRAEFLRLAA